MGLRGYFYSTGSREKKLVTEISILEKGNCALTLLTHWETTGAKINKARNPGSGKNSLVFWTHKMPENLLSPQGEDFEEM